MKYIFAVLAVVAFVPSSHAQPGGTVTWNLIPAAPPLPARTFVASGSYTVLLGFTFVDVEIYLMGSPPGAPGGGHKTATSTRPNAAGTGTWTVTLTCPPGTYQPLAYFHATNNATRLAGDQVSTSHPNNGGPVPVTVPGP